MCLAPTYLSRCPGGETHRRGRYPIWHRPANGMNGIVMAIAVPWDEHRRAKGTTSYRVSRHIRVFFAKGTVAS